MEPTQAVGAPAPGPTPDPDVRAVDDEVVRAATRAERSPKDMALSLLILLVPIALLFGLHRVVLGGDQPAVVDPSPAIAQARSAGAFPVADPAGLADGWRPIRAGFQRAGESATLRIGYVSPSGAGVQVVQTTVPVEQLLPVELTERARPEGTAGLGGRDWQWYTARPGERALVLLEPERTVIVVGAAPEPELRDLAESLG